MRKIIFLVKNASWFTRIVALLAIAAAIISIVTMTQGRDAALNGPITKLPLLTMVMEESDLKEMEAEADFVSEEIQMALETQDPEDIKELEEEYGLSIEDLQVSFEEISLNSVSLAIQAEGDEEVTAIVSGIIKGVSIYAIVIIVLMALAAVFMKKGLMILSFILSLPFYFLLVGVGSITVAAVATVAFFVLVSIVNKNYKSYKKAN